MNDAGVFARTEGVRGKGASRARRRVTTGSPERGQLPLEGRNGEFQKHSFGLCLA